MSTPPPAFIAAHLARTNRGLGRLGLALVLAGAVCSWAFSSPYGFLLVGGSGLLLLAVWLRRRDHRTHPSFKRLARFGDAVAVGRAVDQEFGGADPAATLHLGPTWFASTPSYGLDLVPWREVAWVHLYTHVKNGVRTPFVRVWSRDGQRFEVPVAGEAEAEGLLMRLCERAPWAEAGYSPELEREWGQARAAVLARVDARRPPA